MQPLIFLISILVVCSSIVFAESGDSMDELLDTFVQNSDLSKKTRLENAGNVIIFTRQQLDTMQARSLKDVLKSLPILRYSENRWGFPDPLYRHEGLPFNSKSVRIYINNQEITSAAYGSGFLLLGDIDIGFVDHIEIYSVNPSFEYSTEPAQYLIKLYSKTAKRDKGGSVEVSVGSRGFHRENIQYADVYDDVSYFAYVSRLNDKRNKLESFGSPLSRDNDRYFFYGSAASGGHHLQVLAIHFNRDAFMGLSPDGISSVSRLKGNYYHIGYENRVWENWNFKMTWEKGNYDNHYKGGFNNSLNPLNNEFSTYEELMYTNDDFVFTTNLQYMMEEIEDNKLIVGVKHRYKYFQFNNIKYNIYLDFPGFPPQNFVNDLNYTTQNIYSVYLENHYSLSEKFLITLGTQLSHVDNNAKIDNHNVWFARMGLIYSDETWVVKTFVHRSEFIVEPYLYIAKLNNNKRVLEPEKLENITLEVQYSKKEYKVRAVVGYSRLKDFLYDLGDVKNYSETVTELTGFLEFNYRIDARNSLMTTLSYMKVDNYPKTDTYFDADAFEEYRVSVRLLNGLGKFDFFNEIIFDHSTLNGKNYFDYSAGIQYHYNDNLVISFKGQNIFNLARENSYTTEVPYINVFDDPKKVDWKDNDLMYASPVDQRVYLSIEYRF